MKLARMSFELIDGSQLILKSLVEKEILAKLGQMISKF
jgi:hypothetical protein